MTGEKYEACHEIGNTNVLLTNDCERRDQQLLLDLRRECIDSIRDLERSLLTKPGSNEHYIDMDYSGHAAV